MTTKPDYASKIAALLAKAEDPAATPEEAESYTAKAEALMVKWGISDAQLDERRRKGKKATEKIVEQTVSIVKGDARAFEQLAFGLGYGLGNVRVLKSGVAGSTMGQRYFFIGHESDVERALILFNSLMLQATSARDHWWQSYDLRKSLSPNDRFLAKRQFITSFGAEVSRRLYATRQEAVKEAESTTAGTELVLVDRSKKVDNWLDEKYPKLGKSRGTKGSALGAAEGRAAGQKANLNTTGIGTGKAGEIK